MEVGSDGVDDLVVQAELLGDLVEDRCFLRRDRPAGGADREAGAQDIDPLLLGGECGELTGDHVVLGAAHGACLELGHLGDEHRRCLVEGAVRLELPLDDVGLGVADLEVGVRGPGERVGRRRDEAGPFGGKAFEPSHDAPHRGGIAGRRGGVERGGLEVGCLLVLGTGAEDPTEHARSLGRTRAARSGAADYALDMSLVLRDVRVIDGVSAAPRVRVDVRVEAGRIASIEGHDPGRAIAGDEAVDGSGRTLLPGLIDAHAHYTFDPTEGSLQAIARRPDDQILSDAARHAALALRAGVTTARGAGSIRHLECTLRDRIAAGRIPGPRIVAAGTAVGSIGGHGSGFGLEADGPGPLAEATRRVVASGADVVKVVASEAAMLTTTGLPPGAMVHGAPELSEEEVRAIVEAARDLGVRVMSHAQDSESVRRSAVAGVTSIEHAWLADQAAIAAIARAGAWLVPTLIVTDVNRTLPGMTAVQRERQDLIERRHRASTEAAIRLGIPLATGTDTGEVGVTADMVWREIVLLHEHGLSPMASLQAATSSAARLLGIDGETGSVEVGKSADLLLVDGDPLDDLATLARPIAVWQGGRAVGP